MPASMVAAGSAAWAVRDVVAASAAAESERPSRKRRRLAESCASVVLRLICIPLAMKPKGYSHESRRAMPQAVKTIDGSIGAVSAMNLQTVRSARNMTRIASAASLVVVAQKGQEPKIGMLSQRLKFLHALVVVGVILWPARAVQQEGAMRDADAAKVHGWLARLVGKFEYEGTVEPASACRVLATSGSAYCSDASGRAHQPERLGASGFGDCVAVGDGPGVHCVLDVKWPTPREPSDRDGVRPLSSAMFLLGFDPLSSGIRFQLVDAQSIAEASLGYVGVNTAKFMTRCVNEPVIPSCRRTWLIHASPDASAVSMTLDIEWQVSGGYQRVGGMELSLRRVDVN